MILLGPEILFLKSLLVICSLENMLGSSLVPHGQYRQKQVQATDQVVRVKIPIFFHLFLTIICWIYRHDTKSNLPEV